MTDAHECEFHLPVSKIGRLISMLCNLLLFFGICAYGVYAAPEYALVFEYPLAIVAASALGAALFCIVAACRVVVHPPRLMASIQRKILEPPSCPHGARKCLNCGAYATGHCVQNDMGHGRTRLGTNLASLILSSSFCTFLGMIYGVVEFCSAKLFGFHILSAWQTGFILSVASACLSFCGAAELRAAASLCDAALSTCALLCGPAAYTTFMLFFAVQIANGTVKVFGGSISGLPVVSFKAFVAAFGMMIPGLFGLMCAASPLYNEERLQVLDLEKNDA